MRVVNRYKEKYTIYIGRGSIFGNPFVIGKDGNREEVINQYEFYALNNVNLLKSIYDLPKDAVLGCFCAPLDCHGRIIVELYNTYWKIK